MNAAAIFAKIEDVGILPAVRAKSEEDAVFSAETVCKSGIPIVEITMTTPGYLDVIRHLTRANPDCIVGAGTVPDISTAISCLDAGAAFLTSTGLDAELVEFAQVCQKPIIPGALTPSEVMLARKCGAQLVKIFPCENMGGSSYIRVLRWAFPAAAHLIASGGVTQQTAEDYIRAGAIAIGVGQELLSQRAVRRRDFDWIYGVAQRFLNIVKCARNEISPALSEESVT